MTSKKDFYQSLPAKRMGAGCLFVNEQNAILLVKPSYKTTWEIPGGIVENNESPKQACQREVQEELGLEREIGRMLVVDYNSEEGEYTESLMFIFDGGTLTADEIKRIRLDQSELNQYQFFATNHLPQELSGRLKNRILAAWAQTEKAGGVYLEDQNS